MTRKTKAIAAALIAAISMTATNAESIAAAFVAWQVTGVSSNDVLMVRAFPNASSSILVGYPSGVMLSMTGKCTGDIQLDEIQGVPAWQQRQMVRGEWCELWLDPYATGEFRTGWVFGKLH